MPVTDPFDPPREELTRLFLTQSAHSMQLVQLTRLVCDLVDRWVCDPRSGLPPSHIVLIVRRSERLRTAARFTSRPEHVTVAEGALDRFIGALPATKPAAVQQTIMMIQSQLVSLRSRGGTSALPPVVGVHPGARSRRGDEGDGNDQEDEERGGPRLTRWALAALGVTLVVLGWMGSTHLL